MRHPRFSRLSLLATLASLVALNMAAASCSDGEGGENTPPTLALSPDVTETMVTVGESVTITVLAKDADGDALAFRYTTETNNELSTIKQAQWFTSKGQATFTWSPDSADVTAKDPIKLIFIVEDDRGGYADRQILLNILAGNGKPRFESSSNQLYKNCCDKPISFEVVVRDDDSATLELRMESAPTGATFMKTGEKTGSFRWTPSKEEAKKRVHNVSFQVDDLENPPVSQRVSIIIPPDDIGNVGVDATKENADVCSVEQFLTHTPPGPLRPGKGAGGIPISAIVSDTLAKNYETFFVRWYETLPDDRKEMEDAIRYTVDLERKGQMLIGELPNIVDQAFVKQDAVTMFYKICTSSASADNAGILCIPSAQGTYFSINQYIDSKSVCREETMERLTGNDSFEAAATITDTWSTFFLCQDNPDFHAISLNPGDKKQLLVSYSDKATTTLTLYDGLKTPLPASAFKASPCSGFLQATLEVPQSGSPTTYYLKAQGHDTSYRVRAADLTSGTQTCRDATLEPNDTVEQAIALTPGPTVSGAICPKGDEDIFSIELTTGQRLDAILGFASGAENLADLVIYKPSQRAQVLVDGSGHGSTFGFGEQSESVEYGVRECGTHYLRVLPNDTNSTLDYTLEVALGTDACSDDDEFAKGCNHSAASAPFFGWDTSYGLALCAKGEDWFAHKGLSATTTTIIKALDGTDLSDASLALYKRGAKDAVASATFDKKTGFITLDHTFPDNDTYYFVIASAKDIRYSLSVTQK